MNEKNFNHIIEKHIQTIPYGKDDMFNQIKDICKEICEKEQKEAKKELLEELKKQPYLEKPTKYWIDEKLSQN